MDGKGRDFAAVFTRERVKEIDFLTKNMNKIILGMLDKN